MSGMQLPEGLPDMRPRRRLARLLSTLDPTRLNGWQLAVVLDAQNRQLPVAEGALNRKTAPDTG